MGHSLAVVLDSAVQVLRQAFDSAPERMFHLVSGLVLLALAMGLRR